MGHEITCDPVVGVIEQDFHDSSRDSARLSSVRASSQGGNNGRQNGVCPVQVKLSVFRLESPLEEHSTPELCRHAFSCGFGMVFHDVTLHCACGDGEGRSRPE